jgi:hypothetical protein
MAAAISRKPPAVMSCRDQATARLYQPGNTSRMTGAEGTRLR